MQLGAGSVAAAAFPVSLGAWQGLARAQERAAGPPRRLKMHNLNTGEMLDALYWDAGGYVPDALAAVNKLMRDHHTGEQHVIAPALLDALSVLHGQMEASACYELICGYRAPGTNAAMHRKSLQVASNSLHLDGMAADVRINGVSLEHLQKAALILRRGGVGLYPKSGFVHVDVGPVRHWQGT